MTSCKFSKEQQDFNVRRGGEGSECHVPLSPSPLRANHQVLSGLRPIKAPSAFLRRVQRGARYCTRVFWQACIIHPSLPTPLLLFLFVPIPAIIPLFFSLLLPLVPLLLPTVCAFIIFSLLFLFVPVLLLRIHFPLLFFPLTFFSYFAPFCSVPLLLR